MGQIFTPEEQLFEIFPPFQKRQERFGVVENTEPTKKIKKTDDVLSSIEINKTLKDEKLVKRAERFGVKS